LLLFSLIASAQPSPEQFRNPFHSEDQYVLAHSMFDKISADLSRAQTNYLADNAKFDRAQAQLRVLEQNWDQGHYESRQIEGTMSALQMVLRDNRFVPQDLDAFSNDLSQLLDFQNEYYLQLSLGWPAGCEAFLQGHSQGGPRLFHSLQHFQQKFLLESEKFVIVRRRHIRHGIDIQRIGAHADETKR
jgi:hypothetical protein